jgi:hypothetical protein
MKRELIDMWSLKFSLPFEFENIGKGIESGHPPAGIAGRQPKLKEQPGRVTLFMTGIANIVISTTQYVERGIHARRRA